MADENSFLLVNLKEDKAKELAQVMSNDSCRRILEFLTERKETTETDIARELNIPASTVNYNLKHLYKAGLVTADEFHYSRKGKEVNHYKLANKFIIIAPQDSPGFMEKLKKILPLGIFAAIAAGAIQLYGSIQGAGEAAYAMQDSAARSMPEAAQLMAKLAAEETAPAAASEPNIALWFLLGSVSIIAFMLILELFRKK